MKELSKEEKAKAYDRALAKAKEQAIDGYLYEVAVTDLFPELKESEGERIMENCIHFLELQKSHHASTVEIEECIAWLKKEGEQKPAWNEEDDTFFKAIIRDIENVQYINEDAKKDRISWLKSIKERYAWKPSELQLECLDDAIKHYQSNGSRPVILMELLAELKKLKG